jgi:aminopeptidase N
MKYTIKLLIFAVLFVSISCKNTSKLGTPVLDVEYHDLEPIEITAPKTNFERLTYNPSYNRRNDLIHTTLDVRFDWKRQFLLGKATLTLKPLFYPTDSLRLDAKGFDINKVVIKNGDSEKSLKYVYNDNKNLLINLDRTYNRNEEYIIYIEYTAKPNLLPLGGSAAITSDKGLYFINPLNDDPEKPQQIWTQGETESSSCWFPTIDRPNERCTQEMFITIENKFKTLSNGLLKDSKSNQDGTRTDHWVMDMPHAPYLFMMAIGEYAVVKEEWNGIPLEYYVEPEFEKDAKNIFPYTPEMLTFFSERFGVKYPWQKYSQIVVRDYVSGAMENTTAVIFGEFMQQDSRELMDNSDINEGIVAHEMMHHWFGDLVTCESWSNLPLNESFANYSEYLWFEHKHGRDFADYHRMNDVNGYMSQAVYGKDPQPLIRFTYEDKEDMFDAHSYNKGGTILHMLRHYLGDEAYFEGLRTYLEDNKFSAAEAHSLRLAFEKVSGEDLNWFFNQWFFTKGHPVLQIERSYDASKKQLTVTLEQTQNHKESTVFILPMYVDIHTETGSQKPQRHKITMTEQKQSFVFPVNSKPVWVAVDAERVLLCQRKEEQSTDEWIQQYLKSNRFEDRNDALNQLKSEISKKEIKAVFEKALTDPFWVIRNSAIDELQLDTEKDASIIQKIEKLALNDSRTDVRAAAVEKLGSFKNKAYLETLKKIFNTEKSYRVLNSTLMGINGIDNKEALKIANSLENQTESSELLIAIAELYGTSSEKKYLSFFESNWSKFNDYDAISFFERYFKLLKTINDTTLMSEKIDAVKAIASNPKNKIWQRYGAATFILKFKKGGDKTLSDKAKTALNEIIKNESNPNLKSLFQEWQDEN